MRLGMLIWALSTGVITGPAQADLGLYEFDLIREGAAWAVTLRPSEINAQDAATKALMTDYAAFRVADGDALMATWTAGGRPYPPDGAEFFFLAAAGWMKDTFDAGAYSSTAPSPVPAYQFTRDVIATGENLMKLGFRGHSFTAEEAFQLRLYRLWMNVRLTQAKVAPNEFGLRDPAVRAEGADYSQMRLPRFNAVLQWPGYDNSFTHDRSDFLRPEAVDKIWHYFAGYEPIAGSPEGYVTNRLWTDERIAVETGTSPADWTTLAEAGAGKPLVAIAGYHADIFMKRCFPAVEGLRQVYGEWADFVFLGIYYHDTYATIPEYFGPSAGRNMRTSHPLSFEESARITNLIYLTNPAVSVPTLVDDPSLTMRDQLFGEGGSGQFALLDVNRRLAFTPEHGWNWYNVGRNYSETARYDSILWLNYIERELRVLLVNGGSYGANTDWNPSSPGMAGLNYFYNSAVVTAVDTESGTIGFNTGVGSENLILPIDPGARLHAAFALANVVPGSKLNLQARHSGGVPQAIVEVASSPIAASDTIWRTATLIEADAPSRTITVDLDTPDPAEMIGYQARLGASSGAALFGIGLSNQNRLPVFLAEPAAGRVFIADAATMIFRNGEPAAFADLLPGDRLAFKYLPAEDGKPAPAIDFLRASSPSLVAEAYQLWADAWQALHPGMDFTMEGDADGDRLKNLMEYAFGLSPVDPSPAPVRILPAEGGSGLALRFPRLAVPPPGLKYTVETSTDLAPGSWTALGDAFTIVESAASRGGAADLVEVEISIGPGDTAVFARVAVVAD